MAQGEDDLSSTLAKGHEALFDWNCGQCEDDGRITEAAFYCKDCGSGYCRPCLKLHDKFPVMKQHNVLNRSRIQDWGTQASVSGTGLKCADHVGENISMYCGDHDDVCCPVCISLDHRFCKNMHYIPKLCKNVRQSPEFRDIEADIDKTLSGVRKVRAERKKSKKSLDNSKSKVLTTVKTLRQKVMDTFDELEKHTMNEVDRVYSAVEDKLRCETKICDTVENELDGMKQQLSVTSTKDSQLFVHMKKNQKEVTKFKKAVQRLTTGQELYRFDLLVDPTLVRLVSDVKSLGNIEVAFPMATPYVIKKQSKTCVKESNDVEACFISGICYLPSGRILCSDYHNKKVKLLDSTYKVIDSLKMPEKPRGITCVVYPEAAVVVKNRTIQFLAINNDRITHGRSFSTGMNCYGLAYNTGRFYVSNMEDKVLVYDVEGSLLFKIQNDEFGSGIFSRPRNIAVSVDGSKVHVADVHKGLVTVDREGKHLSTVTDPSLQSAFGICMDNYDNILVSGFDSANVVQFRKGGDQVIGDISGVSCALPRPISICFDRYLSNLIVTSNPEDGCDSLTVLEFE